MGVVVLEVRLTAEKAPQFVTLGLGERHLKHLATLLVNHNSMIVNDIAQAICVAQDFRQFRRGFDHLHV